MSFARAIQQFHHGEISEQQLYSEVDLLLSANPGDPASLIAHIEHAITQYELPEPVTGQIRARIAANTGTPAARTDSDRSWPVSKPTGTDLQTDMSAPQSHSSISAPQSQSNPAPQTATQQLRIGDVLGNRFRLEKLLGEGGMSRVFLAEDQHAYGNPLVAVKVLRDSFSKHPDALVTLKRETSKAQLLTHPNIVNVHDFGIDGPYTYMWMEYLGGGSLYDELKKSGGFGLPPDDAMSVLRDICAALQYAHGREIVHADLKPGNVMFTERDRNGNIDAKIIDFGIARPARALRQKNADNDAESDATIYDPGKLRALTLPYASPEMQASLEPDPRDDIYGLACIAYELFTGNHPFERASAEQAMARKLTVPEHSALNSQQMQAIRHALSFEREGRTATVREFLEEFVAPPRRSFQFPWKSTAAILLVAIGAAAVYKLDLFATNPYAPGKAFRDCPTCPAMTVLPGGSFRQGNSGQAFSNEGPARTVAFAKPFAMSTTEITVGEYRAYSSDQNLDADECTGYGPDGWVRSSDYDWSSPGFAQTSDHPVTCVSWGDASRYAEWLSAKTGFNYRLPSASEWEYAATAGTGRAAESSALCAAGNIADETALTAYPAWAAAGCSDGNVHTAPVGSFEANGFGLHDSIGNVFEWTRDCWLPDYTNAPVDGGAVRGGDCSLRELRGGSWFTRSEFVRPAFRNRLPEDTRTSSIGFRLVRELEEPSA